MMLAGAVVLTIRRTATPARDSILISLMSRLHSVQRMAHNSRLLLHTIFHLPSSIGEFCDFDAAPNMHEGSVYVNWECGLVYRNLMAAMIAAALPVSASAATVRVEATYGSWSVFAAVDPIDDGRWYGAITRSEAGADIQLDCLPTSGTTPQKLNVLFRTKKFLGSGYREATYRVDSKAARKVTGSYGDHTVWPLCDGACKGDGKSMPEVTFAAELKGGENLLLRLRTYRDASLDFTFRIDGAQEAIEHVLAGCARLGAEKNKR